MESVPSCIRSHLVEVDFYYFSGSAPELDLAKFILKNAVQLKKIYLYGDHVKLHIVYQLVEAPKDSNCLSIIVPCGWSACCYY